MLSNTWNAPRCGSIKGDDEAIMSSLPSTDMPGEPFDDLSVRIAQKTADPTPRKVVVVEDNDDSREMLCMMLKSSGYECESIDNGIEALELIDRTNPDVAILDVGLPGMDGLEVARLIRQNPVHDRMTLIALTGHSRDSDRMRAQESCFDAHLVKPVDFKRLLELVADTSSAESRRAR